MRPLLGAVQPEARAACDDLFLVVQVVTDDRAQTQGSRRPVHQRHRIDAERHLRLGVLVELVERNLGHGVALEFDDDAEPVAPALVADVVRARDLGDDLFLGELRDLAHELRGADLVGQFREDDRVPAVLERLVVRPGPHDDAAAAGPVSVCDTRAAHDVPARREVGTLDVRHQSLDVDGRIVDHRDGRVDHLAQVVRRDVGRHTDGDTRRTVDQERREASRQDGRLGALVVIVGSVIDGVFVDVPQHLGRDPRQARLGVPVRGSGEVVGSEVTLSVDKWMACGEVLGEAHERVVDRHVAMRVQVAHDLADDLGALDVRAVRLQPHRMHRVEDAAVNRLEPVPHIRKRTPHDHAHRVIEVRRAHLELEVPRLNTPVAINRHLPAPAGRCVHRARRGVLDSTSIGCVGRLSAGPSAAREPRPDCV